MATYYMQAPFKGEDIARLRIGDMVYVSGKAFTCRSRLHRYVFDEGHPMPEATKSEDLLIHAGPIIIRQDNAWRLVSMVPTSSIRFEKWGARSVDKWNLKMIIGKTTMGRQTTEMMVRKKCVHCSPQGVTPNLFIDQVEVLGVDYFDELGSIEATWQLELNQLGPFVVDIDCEGNNLFDALDVKVLENKKKAYEIAGIPQDFEFTKLY